jgi:hypothetical protein
MLLRDAQVAQLGGEAVDGGAAGGAAGKAGGEHYAVIRQHGGGNALVSDGLPKHRHHDRAGHRLVAGDGERVAGMIVQKAQNLGIGTGCAVTSGESVVGEVDLPHLVGLFGGEADVGRFGFLLRLRDDQPGRLQGAPDCGLRDGQLMLLDQMPRDGVGAGIQPSLGQLMPQPDDQRDGAGWDRRRLAVRLPGPRLERRLTLDAVAGDQTAHPPRRHVVATGSLANSPALNDNSGNDQAGLRHPETQAGLCFLCLATCVSYVVKQDTPRTQRFAW